MYLREHDGDRFLIALNFGSACRELDLSTQAATCKILISTSLDRSDEVADLSRLSLRPHEGLLLAV